MRIVFLSNYFNHHQSGISDKLFKISKGFEFISTSEMRQERKELGYNENDVPSYVKKLNKENEKEIFEHIEDADIVIRGSAPSWLTKKRVWKNKVTFRYSERPFKTKESFLKHIPRFLKWHLHNPINKSVYLLCASAYTSYDYRKYRLFKNKAYKWGYFPETKYYDLQNLMDKKEKYRILWCGRFLDWKHPDDVIKIGEKLKEDGYKFEIHFIGTGALEKRLKQLVDEVNLNEEIKFLGSMKPEQVRKHMEESGIFLFTSDKQEGWGAVLNEAMNSGCAVIASHAIGSVPYLIGDNKNGFVYKSEDVESLYKKVKYLLDYPEEQKRLGKKAYETIVNTWNADVASERLLNLSKLILSGDRYPNIYHDGPCSKAEIIKDDWFCE